MTFCASGVSSVMKVSSFTPASGAKSLGKAFLRNSARLSWKQITGEHPPPNWTMEKRPCFWKTTADPEKGPMGLKHILERTVLTINNSASFLRCWESFLAFHFEQCSKPFTPYRLWFKILIRKHFKNDVVAHLGCSLSSPTPKCVRRPACAVANKALLGLWQNGWKPESMLCWSILWMFVEYLLALLCRCIFCCWVSIWLRMFGPLRAVGPANKHRFLDFVDIIFLDSDLPPKVSFFHENSWSNLLNSTFNLWGTQRSTDKAQ